MQELNFQQNSANTVILELKDDVVIKVYNSYTLANVEDVKPWLQGERASRYFLQTGDAFPQLNLVDRAGKPVTLSVSTDSLLVYFPVESDLTAVTQWLNYAEQTFPQVQIVPILCRNLEIMQSKNILLQEYPDLLTEDEKAKSQNSLQAYSEWIQNEEEIYSVLKGFDFYLDLTKEIPAFTKIGSCGILLVDKKGVLLQRWSCTGYVMEDTKEAEMLLNEIAEAIQTKLID